ncbi:GntR family transcriptional regulator, transcriptional repressor for pyruvate dehydrogenase complex [Devosia lucknowensis]|uniref:GntR family transcriptional regulator, transcriptional repressor for pyruvate dehydrogenase complex n=1 Tax=Devosia lucknowensis TaxID=1096929 RepID=A0A1Y6FBL5_9HYPH|nr:FadR/GntR family transcriptional regulator [Devosia lucknowensis]SMQ72177.1 GntR family transcriptional regulator, transcriptional repressor for pyruvate dehydrogenase complex [Devosia lucknowensis]
MTGESRPDQASAAAAVADDLANEILTELTPGANLPSEAELAERFSVSRLTIREAVKLLAGRGLLELSRGRRAVVREPDGAAFADFLTALLHNDSKGLFDLVEVRLSLEVQSATMAAKRGSRAGTAAIESALQGMRDTAASAMADDPEADRRFHDCDVAFHEAIALASGNRILGYLFEAMSVPLRQGIQISRRGHANRGHTLLDTIAAHERILEAIRSGNGRAAGEAMRLHLKDTERDIRNALSSMADRPPRTRSR